MRFCGANDRDFEIFRAGRGGNRDHRARAHRRDAPPLPPGAESREILQGLTRQRSLERGVPVLHVPRGRRDRRRPRVHDPPRLHGRARLRALGRSGPRSRPLGCARRGRDAPRGMAAHRHGRARSVPDRGRLHHRRRRVRPDGLPVRVRPRLVGRPRQGRVPGKGRLPAGPGRDRASADERRARLGRRRRVRRATLRRRRGGRPRDAGRRLPAPRRQDARAGQDPGDLRRARRQGSWPPSREECAGEVVRHPVYDPERRRARES